MDTKPRFEKEATGNSEMALLEGTSNMIFRRSRRCSLVTGGREI